MLPSQRNGSHIYGSRKFSETSFHLLSSSTHLSLAFLGATLEYKATKRRAVFQLNSTQIFSSLSLLQESHYTYIRLAHTYPLRSPAKTPNWTPHFLTDGVRENRDPCRAQNRFKPRQPSPRRILDLGVDRGEQEYTRALTRLREEAGVFLPRDFPPRTILKLPLASPTIVGDYCIVLYGRDSKPARETDGKARQAITQPSIFHVSHKEKTV